MSGNLRHIIHQRFTKGNVFFFCSGIWRIASFIQYFSGVHDLALRGKSRAHQRKGEPSNEFLQALDPSLAHNLPAVPESDCFFTLVPRWRIASFIQTICQEPSAIQANRRLLTGGVKGNHRYIFQANCRSHIIHQRFPKGILFSSCSGFVGSWANALIIDRQCKGK